MLEDGVLRLLPTSLRIIANEIGLETAIKLIRYCSGKRIYIPQKGSNNAKKKCKTILEAWFSEEEINGLSMLHGGTNLEVPRSDSLKKAIRNQAIAISYQVGIPKSELASFYGLTNRHISNITRC